MYDTWRYTRATHIPIVYRSMVVTHRQLTFTTNKLLMSPYTNTSSERDSRRYHQVHRWSLVYERSGCLRSLGWPRVVV